MDLKKNCNNVWKRENVKKQLAFLVDASAEAMTLAPEQLPDARCNASFIFNV